MKRDENGQPVVRDAANWTRMVNRGIDELIGFCRGVVADGIVNQTEAEAILAWIERNPQLATTFPANVLFARLEEVLQDGKLQDDEAKELFDLIMECIGASGDVSMEPCTATLPYTKPVPEIFFDGHNFVLTGRFAHGPRKEIEKIIYEQGGDVKGNVSESTDYLVCGHFASTDWLHSSHGRKIEGAIRLQARGCRVCIVSERHLFDTINETNWDQA